MDAARQADNRKLPNAAEMLNAAAIQWARVLCHENLHTLLDAHEDRLRNWAQSSAEWLDRRHSFAADSRRLLLRLQSCEDVTDMLAAQSEWAGATWRRMAADYAAWTGLAMAWPATTMATPARTAAPAARPRGAAGAEARKASLDHLLAARGGRGEQTTATESGTH